MGRLTDNDRRFGPVTFGRSSFDAWRLVYSSGGGGDDDRRIRNNITAYAFGWVAQIKLPALLAPFRVRHVAHWDAATVERMGRDWYDETFPREYGFSLSDGFLQLFLGAQTHDSTTTQSWCIFLPWTQWRHVRYSLYDTEGQHFWTQREADRKKGGSHFDEQMAAEKRCPAVRFEIEDCDGTRNKVTTHIEEREWRFGEGWFKWLSLFRRPRVRRSLALTFDSEIGPEKGSWKGGLIGTGVEMLAGELHEAAFRRYCDQEHRAKYGRYRITFIGPAA